LTIVLIEPSYLIEVQMNKPPEGGL
jgi:hypothetical protein